MIAFVDLVPECQDLLLFHEYLAVCCAELAPGTNVKVGLHLHVMDASPKMVSDHNKSWNLQRPLPASVMRQRI